MGGGGKGRLTYYFMVWFMAFKTLYSERRVNGLKHDSNATRKFKAYYRP